MNKERTASFQSTLKSSDTEEWLDIVFYRRIGYRMALICARLGVTPNQVTLASIFVGIAAGLLFYPSDLSFNVAGICLLIVANTMDSADGQLARMTGQSSRLGRWLDGLSGELWFTSIYVSLGFRMLDDGFSAWIAVPILLAGYFHAKQASMADYYRNLHLNFLRDKMDGEFDCSRLQKERLQALSWQKNPFNAFAVWTYWRYTLSQEKSTNSLQNFLKAMQKKYGSRPSDGLRKEFLRQSRPLMKYTNILTFNTRAIVLFAAVLLNLPWIYFFFELTALNILLSYLVRRHEKICKELQCKIEAGEI